MYNQGIDSVGLRPKTAELRTLDIPGAVSNIRNEIENLHKTIEELSNRLSGIVMCGPEDPQKENAPRPPMVPHAEELNNFVGGIAHASSRLTKIINGLQL